MKLLIRVRPNGKQRTIERGLFVPAFNRMQVGARQLRVRTRVSLSLYPHCISVHRRLARELGLHDGMMLGWRMAGSVLRLGPVVGVLMSKGRVRKLRLSRSQFRIDALVDANREVGCLLYFFTLGDVDLAKQTVRGTIYNYQLRRWQTRTFPLFEVLYDRGGGFTPKQRVLVQGLREQLDQTPGLRKVNAVYHFDKWDQYERLNRRDRLVEHLPQTLPGTEETLSVVLNRHARVFVKGVFGSNGLEVMRVDREGEGYRYSYVKSREVKGKVSTIAELRLEISRFLKNKRFVVQQGIVGLQHNGKNLDFRILLQRDGRGIWQMTDAPVRVSVTDTISSTRSGSTVYTFYKAAREVLGWSEQQTIEFYKRLEKFGLKAVASMESAYGKFGELGIDVVVEQNTHKLWFIEANAKPGKDTVIFSGNRHLAHVAFARPLSYCRYLAGFPPMAL